MAMTKIQIGPADHGRQMTLEDFLDADECSGYRYELARGTLEVTEIPDDPHWQVISNLHEALSKFRSQNPGPILRVGHASDILMMIPGLVTARRPDLGFVLRGTQMDAWGQRRPHWIAEVVSPGAAARERDYVAKREEYLAFGLAEYWIVDPRPRQVTVLSRRDEGAQASWVERVFRDADMIDSRVLTDFALAVSNLWVDVELDAFGG